MYASTKAHGENVYVSNCSFLDFPNQSLTSEGVIVRELFALDIVTSVTTLIAPKGERRGIKNATIPDVYSRFRGADPKSESVLIDDRAQPPGSRLARPSLVRIMCK